MLLPALIRDRTLIDHRRHGGAVVVRTSALRALRIRSPTNVVLKVLRMRTCTCAAEVRPLHFKSSRGNDLRQSRPQNSTAVADFLLPLDASRSVGYCTRTLMEDSPC